MAKTLLLLRHGKSDWDASYEDDHDRPLAKRGRKAAASMGELLEALGECPELVITSTALRAADTVRRAVKSGVWSSEIREERTLYGASPESVLELIRATDDSVTRLLLAGHEPTWSELAGRLIGEGQVRVPTGALVRIDFEHTSWADIAFGDGTLHWLIPPRVLKRGRS